LEDFGDDLYANVLGNGADQTALYCAAIDAIARLHIRPAPHLLAGDVPLYAYDLHAQLAETDLMTEWFVPLALGRSAAPDEVSEHRALWREALTGVRAPGSVFVHRDYHAQNLFWLAERQGLARVGMIDFQDALDGKRRYLSFVPRVWRYLERDLSHPILAKLRAWYDRAIPSEARSGMEMA